VRKSCKSAGASVSLAGGVSGPSAANNGSACEKAQIEASTWLRTKLGLPGLVVKHEIGTTQSGCDVPLPAPMEQKARLSADRSALLATDVIGHSQLQAAMKVDLPQHNIAGGASIADGPAVIAASSKRSRASHIEQSSRSRPVWLSPGTFPCVLYAVLPVCAMSKSAFCRLMALAVAVDGLHLTFDLTSYEMALQAKPECSLADPPLL
jgi:hypothetical protein